MQIKKEFIPLFKGVDLTTKRLPYLVAQADKPGPIIWLTAAIHGDEVTGTAIIQSVFKRLEDFSLEKGAIYAFPVLNIPGFETISRHEVYGGSDINRQFGSENSDSTSKKQAMLILSKILQTQPNYLIDFHSDSVNSIPYTIVDYPTNLTNLDAFNNSITLAESLKFFWAVDTQTTAGYPPEHCLTGRLITEGIPAITIEIGAPLVVMEESRQLGLEALWNFFKSLNMFSNNTANTTIASPKKIYTFSERIRTQSIGIIEYRVKPGDNINLGQILGKISNIFGETIEVIRSPISGILFSHEDQSVTFPGQALFTIAVESDLKSLT